MDKDGERVAAAAIAVFSFITWSQGQNWLLASLVSGFGLLVGVVTLPWRRRFGSQDEFTHVCAWTGFWPFLALYLALQGLKAYVRAWYGYLGEREEEKRQRAERRAAREKAEQELRGD